MFFLHNFNEWSSWLSAASRRGPFNSVSLFSPAPTTLRSSPKQIEDHPLLSIPIRALFSLKYEIVFVNVWLARAGGDTQRSLSQLSWPSAFKSQIWMHWSPALLLFHIKWQNDLYGNQYAALTETHYTKIKTRIISQLSLYLLLMLESIITEACRQTRASENMADHQITTPIWKTQSPWNSNSDSFFHNHNHYFKLTWYSI